MLDAAEKITTMVCKEGVLKSEESDGENKKWFFIFDCTAYTYVRRCVVEFNLKSVLM
jgi:hypothetical protein